MSDSSDPQPPPVCAVCGTVLSDAAGGLCPRCLMAQAAQPTNVPGAGSHRPPKQEDVAASFPQFEVIERIGAGGMGTVWRARQPKLNRHVALKLLPASLAQRDPAFAERFEREGQLLARLHHPNIVAVHDSGRAGDFFYLVMEYVDGVNLRQAMRASRFRPGQALAIVPKICDALQYAHEEGVLHRDIKPENILLDTKGRVKLVDFGIAKLIGATVVAGVSDVREPLGVAPSAPPESGLTAANQIIGTPNYMAPEQIEKPSNVDHRADIYSLGVVFYELLTGELPTGSFAPPSSKSAADPRVDAIVRQALEKERARRQSSAGEMKTQVETFAQAKAPQRPVPILRWRDRWLWDTSYVVAITLCAGLLTALVAPWLIMWHRQIGIAFLAIVSPGFLLAGIYGLVGHRVRLLKRALPNSEAEVAEALIFRRPFQAPGLAVLHADRLELIRILGEPIIIPIADIASISEAGWFNGSYLFFKHGFVFDLANGQRVGVAVPEPFARRWRAQLSRGGLPDLSVNMPINIPAATRLDQGTRGGWKLATVLIAIAATFVLLPVSCMLMRISTHMPSTPELTGFHTQVFEADAATVDNLIPKEQRRSGIQPGAEFATNAGQGASTTYKGDFTVSKRGDEMTDSQLANISTQTLDALLYAIPKPPGVLVDRTREVSTGWWKPGLADSWAYSGGNSQISVSGGGTFFLGVQPHGNAVEVRVECNRLNHYSRLLNAPGPDPEVVSKFLFEADPPTGGDALAFLVPFPRKDGSAHYLVITFQFTQQQAGATTAAQPTTPPRNLTFDPVIERLVELHGQPGGYNLETGEFFSYPQPSPFTASSDAEWLRRFGVDVLADKDSLVPAIFFVGGLASNIDNSYWDAPASQIAEHPLLPPAPLPGAFDAHVASLPASRFNEVTTWLIRTQGGKAGLLQTVGLTEDPRGVKIRYKLMRETAGAPGQ